MVPSTITAAKAELLNLLFDRSSWGHVDDRKNDDRDTQKGRNQDR
jgi:hypothetical protein